MAIDRHLNMYISLRDSGALVAEAIAAALTQLGSLSDRDYSLLILAIASYEIETAGTRPALAVPYSNRMRASSARISSRTF